MLEAEAKLKWCPMGRVVNYNEPAVGNLWHDTTATQHPMGACIASQCMMWRWTDHGLDMPRNTWEGYCGLAGRP